VWYNGAASVPLFTLTTEGAMKIVLFLGAGFSARFGYPVMVNFDDALEKAHWVTDEERTLYKELKLSAQRASSYLEGHPTNLEGILSFAMMSNRLSLEADSAERSRAILRILYKVFTTIKTPGSYWDELVDLERFMSFDPWAGNYDFEIVTTNYDLCIECALRRIDYYARLPIDVGGTGEF
jgi:hypothetical protein